MICHVLSFLNFRTAKLWNAHRITKSIGFFRILFNMAILFSDAQVSDDSTCSWALKYKIPNMHSTPVSG
jgi:hypothetical protein